MMVVEAPSGGPTPPGAVRVASRGGLADLVADAELEKAGVLSPSQAPPPSSGRMLRVEVRGLLHDWFDVADMGDFIRSPQFAGTLRENVARYFGVPIERQAIYDEDGLLTSCADYSRALQRFYPKLFIYDLEEMGPDLRARAVEELRQLDADVEQSWRQFGAGRVESRGISSCPKSQEPEALNAPVAEPFPTATDHAERSAASARGVQGGGQGSASCVSHEAKEPYFQLSTGPLRSDAPTVSPRTVTSQARPLPARNLITPQVLTPRSAIEVAPQAITPQSPTPRSALEIMPQSFAPREVTQQALTPRNMLEVAPQSLTPRILSSHSQPRLLAEVGSISPRIQIPLQPARLEPAGNARMVSPVLPRHEHSRTLQQPVPLQCCIHRQATAAPGTGAQAWLVSSTSALPAAAAVPATALRSPTPPPVAPVAHGNGRVRRVSVGTASVPRLQLGLGGLPPPPGISLSLKPDLPQLKQLGQPFPPVSPRVLRFPN
eukprot:symbB.v1.2.001587.t1/scaffold88.1/size340390/22